MKFKVLGCSGSRHPGHSLTSYCINGNVLVDAGAVCGYMDIDGQMGITDILVSHSNLDHTKDILFLADNIAGAVYMGDRVAVNIRSQPKVLESIQKHLLNNDIWPDFTKIPSQENPALRLVPLELGTPFAVDGLHALAFSVPHSAGSTGYLIYGDKPGENVAITGDTGPDAQWTDFLNASPIQVSNLVVECSFPNELDELARVSDHLTPRLLRKMLERLDRVPKLFITHIKAMYASTVQEQMQCELADYQYHLPRKGDSYIF